MKFYKNLDKEKLPNSIVLGVGVLILLFSIVVIFFPIISEQQQQQDEAASALKMAKSNVSIDILVSKGYIDGNIANFIATDASDKHAVSSITNNTN